MKAEKSQDLSQDKSQIAKKEEEILKFWQDNKIFEKSLQKDSPGGNFIFYDGPPFATGLPHFGHILASAIKDAVPRYQTMLGMHVERVWGWDCHGLPIENIVEKDLKISGKKEIEAYGVEKFNSYARSKVLEYVHEWKKTVERMGRWVDFDGSYKTMDGTFMESVLWAFKEIYDKGLVYESTKVLPYCPRCETPVSNSEIAMDNSYKDITDISVYAKFELMDELGTYILAWTTTPWTLPGNFALAVDAKTPYIKARKDNSLYIVAKILAEKVLKDNYEIVEEMTGADLVGKSYKPVFDYFKNIDFPNKENAWKIYTGDFITTEEGTGIVHVAPGYGEEDLDLSKTESIPFIHHVDHQGKFTNAVTDFAGVPVKPKGDHQSADIQIIKKMAHGGTLFAKEKIIHSYPHCFRCDTPLYYYAIPAWFINIQKSKSRFLQLNEKIHWVPEHLKHGRFGKSAEGAPDWNISRNRYWATPLPIWRNEKTKELKVIGSVNEIKELTKRNNYFLMRHGEAEHNVKSIMNSRVDDPKSPSLTEKGKEQIQKTIEELKSKKIDVIIYSPISRTKETAKMISEGLGIKENDVISDDRLKEEQFGDLEGLSNDEYQKFFLKPFDRILTPLPNGESIGDIRKRIGEFLYDTDSKYKSKNILVITHDGPSRIFQVIALGGSGQNLLEAWNNLLKKWKHADYYIAPGDFMDFDFAQIPHNQNYALDFHRPYIDEVVFEDEEGNKFKRVSEVLDGWFESGSMSFAQKHYPFENKEWFHENFPADFVAEYIAQTRTWFYYMHTVSTILFDNEPFENVVTTGTVLAEDGQKMSKSKGNFPDPWIIFDKYSVDALRFYLLSSPLLKSEDLNFSEKGVDEVNKKIILRLKNVCSFYELYATEKRKKKKEKDENVLDQWIMTRLSEVTKQVTDGMNDYEFDKALAPFDKFIDDLSTWYLRRSRDRFKGDKADDKEAALSTIRLVLETLSKLVAPFMPFLAEDIYQRVKDEDSKESVHLESWPKPLILKPKPLLKEMEEVRKIVSLGLEARAKAGIKVRQPLAELRFRTDEHDISENAQYLELIKDEVNVKETILDAAITNEIELDINISVELKEEGMAREIMRAIQDLRKESDLQVGERAVLIVSTSAAGKALVEKFKTEISKTAALSEINFGENNGEEIKIDDIIFKLKLEK